VVIADPEPYPSALLAEMLRLFHRVQAKPSSLSRRDRWFESGSLQRRIRCELDLGEGRFADEIACLSLAGRREVISSGVLPIRARTLAGAGVRCRAVVFRVQNGGRRGVFWVREAADVALKIIARRKPEPVYRPVAVEAVEVINFAITLATWLNSDDLVRRRLEATGEARRDRGRA
jgi:hypothetical protein